jgi:hypothetical protein
MSPTGASLVATTISFAVFILYAVWYAAPWMNRRTLAVALSVPLWIHAFRSVALQVFSAQRSGFRIPDNLAQQIAWGDVAGGVLALAALFLLHTRSRAAIVMVWLFVIETVVDFANASLISIQERTSETASALTWLILNLYVPLLVVSLGLVVWQLVSRRGEDPYGGATSSA